MTLSVRDRLRRPTPIFALAVGVYLLAIVVPALLGHFAFVVKAAIAPILFVAAMLLGRLRSFVRDWAVFLGLTVVFDFLRGLLYWFIVTGDRPVFMGYAIDLERMLCGGRLLTITLQELVCDPPRIRFLEKFLVVVHGSHFLFLLLFGFLVWSLRREEFGRFKAGLIGVMYVGLLFYFLIPTVPPWMASDWYGAIPPIFHFPELVYNATVPSLYASFETNLIAAMPSLHTAFPFFFCCVAFQLFGRRGVVVLVYLLAVVFSLVCSGEHYLVDVLAGAVLGGAMFLLVFKVNTLASRLDMPAMGNYTWRATLLSRPVIAAIVIFVGSQVSANRLAGEDVQLRPSAAFIENELQGRTNTAHYYRGLLFEEAGRRPEAQHEFSLAVAELGASPLAAGARLRLGRVAHRNGDDPVAIAALGGLPLDSLDSTTAVMLGVSLLRQGAGDEALAIFNQTQQKHPGEPMSLYWQTRALFQGGRISAAQLQAAVEQLRAIDGNRDARRMADHLESMSGGR